LIEACNNEDTPLHELAEIIAKDPALASKALRLVNSAYVGIRDPVTSLEKAVVYLGAATIKNIAISASVLQAFSGAKSGSIFNLEHFWWHSFMCAALARRMAKRAGLKNPEEAFLSGLFHDIGKLILWQYFPKEYGQILEEADSDPIRLPEREAALVASHAEVGAWLARQWHIDTFIADAVAYHHETVEDILNAFPLVKIVYVANRFSRSAPEKDLSTGGEVAKAAFGFTASQMETLIAAARDEVVTVAGALDIPVSPPPRRETGYPSKADDALLIEIKNISLLYGTLENLLKADGKDAILQVVERGLRIVFDVQSLIFFLYDSEGERLVGNASEARPDRHRIRDLILPGTGAACLPAQSLTEQKILDSADVSPLSIADRQLIRMLGAEGMLCVPLTAYHQWVGAIVMGVESARSSRFAAQEKLLQMFANHAAVCLYIEDFKQKQVKKIQAERMEAVSLMARKVVHETNNPLGIIKNYLKILGLKLPERHPAQEDIGIIGKEIDRVFKIVRRLNRFSQSELHTEQSVDLNRLFTEQFKLLRKSILTTAGIDDHLALAERLPRVAADENSLKQVFQNLIKNAAEAMPNGGNLYIRTQLVPDKRSYSGKDASSNGVVEITIKDDGPGIPEDIRSRLFEPFTSSKTGEHRGLGLSIVHNIIKEHNGSILCESDSEQGTCFTILLPVSSNGEK
jgi:putative nucleotidyltransferase with HDIG domain